MPTNLKSMCDRIACALGLCGQLNRSQTVAIRPSGILSILDMRWYCTTWWSSLSSCSFSVTFEKKGVFCSVSPRSLVIGTGNASHIRASTNDGQEKLWEKDITKNKAKFGEYRNTHACRIIVPAGIWIFLQNLEKNESKTARNMQNTGVDAAHPKNRIMLKVISWRQFATEGLVSKRQRILCVFWNLKKALWPITYSRSCNVKLTAWRVIFQNSFKCTFEKWLKD